MIKNTWLAKTIIVTGALVFSIPTLAEVTLSETTVSSTKSEATVSSTKKALPAAPSDCIADSKITAVALSDTRDNGPFSIHTKDIPRQSAKGFGGGTIHYPTNASGCGLLGAIAVVPGYVSYENSIKWWGPRLASWGFVVITINTNSIYDDPDSRATQLNAALDQMIADDTVGSMIDPKRLGAIGWSMGGGGALKLATERSTVRAIMPLAPYHDKSYGEVKTPTLVIACENDRIAETKKYANAFYKNAIGPKMKVEVNNGSHFCPSYRFNEILLSKPGIAWMQRYINNDTRFDKFLCANENYSKSPRISAYDYKNCL